MIGILLAWAAELIFTVAVGVAVLMAHRDTQRRDAQHTGRRAKR